MTASEFAFLALGLVLGVASGAAIIVTLHSRPPAPREVRVTVAPNSVPRRRPSTLAEDAFATMPQEPARGGPADRRTVDRDGSPTSTDRGTLVRSGGAESGPQPPAGAGDPASGAVLSRYGSVRGESTVTSAPVAVRVHDETDWTLEALRATAARTATQAISDQRLTAAAVLERPASPSTPPREATESGDTMHETRAHATAPGNEASSDAPTSGATIDPNDPCGDARRVADERCTLAKRSRGQAETAHEALRAAQRAYDEHQTRAERATVAADPRTIRVAKETAQHAFRHARATATNRDEIEAAARDWLTEINRINGAAREAAAQVQNERAAANALVMTIERLSVEADAARISAEAAEVACTEARESVADCQEAVQAALRAAVPAPAIPPVPPPGIGAGFRPDDGSDSELEAAFTATGAGEPAILRLMRGDRATLGGLVTQLAGEDEQERRRWQRSLGDLVDAIVGRSIEAAALTFPLEHPFWGNFSLAQNRDIVAALASLGFRFDGLGGWVDDRVPGQRDLSLAVGYAGLDPMRLRRWPNEEELHALFDGVAVAADEYLAETAGGLTLGELVDVLGRRADGLTELWNEWGRVRPLLLAGG